MNKPYSKAVTANTGWLIPALLLVASAAQADVFHVTSNADFGAGTLRNAIDQANANPGPDEITFAEALGTITVTGQMDISDTLTITGPTGGQVISGDGQTRILAVTTEDTPLTLENLVLTDGLTTADSQTPACTENDGTGGALCSRSVVHLKRVTIQNSRSLGANAYGGGLWLTAAGTITDSIIRNNRFEGTTSASAGGGGLHCSCAGETLSIHNSLIEGNTAVHEASFGGGLSISAGFLVLTDSTVADNVAGRHGGGIYARSGRIENSTISGNSATRSGVLLWINATQGLVIRNTTITDNHATDPDDEFGAGLRLTFSNQDVNAQFDSVLLAGNSGFLGNLGAVPIDPDWTSQVTVDAVHSLFGDDASEINGQNLNNIFSDDPRLQPLADQGCAVPAGAPGTEQCVPVHAFMAGSPAVNAGSNPEGLEFDQRGPGFPRVNDGQADIGAYESNDGIFADRFEAQS
jgi:hypothetical protein